MIMFHIDFFCYINITLICHKDMLGYAKDVWKRKNWLYLLNTNQDVTIHGSVVIKHQIGDLICFNLRVTDP